MGLALHSCRSHWAFCFSCSAPCWPPSRSAFTEWDLLSPAQGAGLRNWQSIFSVSVVHTDQAIDEASGELLFQCGRHRNVPASELADWLQRLDERSGLPFECNPGYLRDREVLPARFGVVSEVMLFGQRWLLSARDHLLWIALFNTVYMLLAVPAGMALALGVAIVLNQQLRGRQMLRAIFYLPNVLPIAATSVIWLWIFNPEFGILNHLLGSVGLPSNGRWLSDQSSVKPSLMLMGIWSALGFQMLIYLAALQAVPRQLYEAAEIDGADLWGRFRFVTWPSLSPTSFFLLVTGLIFGFQSFAQPYIMTRGGPANASRTVVMEIWKNGFADLEMGYASAQAWLAGRDHPAHHGGQLPPRPPLGLLRARAACLRRRGPSRLPCSWMRATGRNCCARSPTSAWARWPSSR